MTTDDRIATHGANADRLIAERDARDKSFAAWLQAAAVMAFFALMAAWGYSILALGCRGWSCLLPGGM
jgi:hypothetical protein